ncbi:hypothetical protein [Arenibacterium sp. LLYu02]|uniref:hypothetical protein n=1 Tax=Arenibacterium sp. LLYu02 TaxID=3404132 RepID=UPI003B210424
MSNVSYSTQTGKAAQGGGYPDFGWIPKSAGGRLFLGWGGVNVVLALLPVFDLYGNGAQPGPLGMPLTVFYCYAVFSLNYLLGLVYFLTRGRACVEIQDNRAAEDNA